MIQNRIKESMERHRSLIVIFFTITSLNLTSFGQVADSEEIFDSNHICISDQYIMQSYFPTHSSLLDSEFRRFLNLQQCSNKIHDDTNFVSLIQRRNITGEGSHRNLVTSIKLESHSEESKFYELVIVERLPLGVFADPFELQSLRKSRGFSDVGVFGDTNLELPSFTSNRSVVEIHVEIGSRDYEKGEVSVKLPLHARYQPLEESGYSRVEFGEPDMFLCSSYVQNQGQEQRRCLVLSVSGSKTESSSVVWKIPAGIRDHTEYVSAFTFAAAVLSAFSILVASVLSSKVESCKNSKQS